MSESDDQDNRLWPTPSFDRPDIKYTCSMCGEVVNPDNGDQQAALLKAGGTTKLCGDCAGSLRMAIHGMNSVGSGEETDGERVHCQHCGAEWNGSKLYKTGDVLRCPSCDGVMRP